VSAQPGRSAGVAEALRGLSRKQLFFPVVTLLLLLAFSLVVNPRFFSVTVRGGHLYGSLVDILNRAAPLVIIAAGLTLVIATKGIDISVGAVVAISGATAASLIGGQIAVQGMEATKVALPFVILGAMAVGLAFGMWNGLLVSVLGLQPIIATLILMVAGRGVAQLITDGRITTIYYRPFFFVANGFLLGIPFPLFIAGAVLLTLGLLTRRTSLGVFIESIGVNPVASRSAGVRAGAILFWAYAVCGLCAGIAGIVVASNVKSADGNNAGLLFELDAILAVVLGGTSMNGGRFSLVGSLLGALIIQTLTTTIYAVGVPPEITMVVKAVVVFVVSVIQSEAVRALIWRRTEVAR
jgi:simple sugar transport system permease protein